MPNPRVEALLSAAEGGSPPHLTRLWHDWPQNLTDSKRALTILLHHFKSEGRFLHNLANGQGPREGALRVVSLIRSCLCGFDGALGYLTNAGGSQAEQMFQILKPGIDDLLAWFYFFGRASPWILPEHRSSFGASNAAARIATLLRIGSKYLEDDPGCRQSIVDFVLWAWMVEDPARETESPDWELDDYDQRLTALSACQDSGPMRRTLLQRLRSADRRFLKDLAATFSGRCLQWAAASRSRYKEDPATVRSGLFSVIVSIARYFTNAEPFSRALRKSGFPTLAVKLGLEFRNCPTSVFRDLEPNKRGTLAAEITSRFLDMWLLSAKDVLYLMPDILDAGLIHTVLDDLISLSKGMKPLNCWVDLEEGKPTPLQWIARDVTFHPNLVRSLFSAIEETQCETSGTVFDDPVVSEHWDGFIRSIEVHRTALRKYETNCITLCDNLHHHPRGSVLAIGGECKKCACCQTTVYCSPICQRRDWEALHKSECQSSHHRRIELEHEGGWLGHQTRMFNLRVLETLLAEHMESGLPESPHSEGQRAKEETAIFLADLTKVPREISTETPDTIVSKEFWDVVTFSCARSRAMLQAHHEDSDGIRIACSLTGMGQFMVATMARFRVVQTLSKVGAGGEAVGRRELVLLNGFVRVLDEPRGKAYRKSLGSDDEDSTG